MIVECSGTAESEEVTVLDLLSDPCEDGRVRAGALRVARMVDVGERGSFSLSLSRDAEDGSEGCVIFLIERERGSRASLGTLSSDVREELGESARLPRIEELDPERVRTI